MSRFARDLHRKSCAVALAAALPCAVASAAGPGEAAADADAPPSYAVLASPVADLALSDVQEPAGAAGNERSVLGWLQGLMGARPQRGALVERRLSSGGRDPASVLALEQGPPGLALLCESSPGGSLGFVRQCLLARLELDPLELPGYGQGVGLSAHWNPSGVGLDMSFGLGWLDPRQPQRLPGRQSAAPVGRGLMEFGTLGLNLPTPATAALSVQLDGRMNIGTDGWLSLGVQQLRGRNETVNLWGQVVPVFESESLRLAGGFGDFSGALTGRVIELQGTPGSLNSLDLGLSWRTPWRGELTVGATQYWSRGDSSQWPLRELPSVVEESGGRVPYVRYHQDL